MQVLAEFKAFVMRGNVLDLAVGVVIGAAFGRIVTALVEQLLLPPLGLLVGGIDFSYLRVVLRAAQDGKPEVALGVGLFLNAVLQFALMASAVFVVVKAVNRATKRAAPPVVAPPADVLLLRDIKDLLVRADERARAGEAPPPANP